MNVPIKTPTILECTIRDGNYSVDFKFTEADTTLVTEQLVKLGFRWIEVGHGLGLGAMEAGKGTMPASDVELIHAAKKNAANAKIGMFFIPEIGKKEHLSQARDAGLDFIRIGSNAPEAEEAFPYIEYAQKLGLTTCLNIMKSYAILPEEFAKKAKLAVGAGAEIVYCVDSAGSMLPEDIARYFDATRAIVDCKLGFHGHNNLMMAISNCIEAYRHGVQFFDTTLCGLGRSAGNAPTEIFVAVFERMGIPLGIDIFNLMDVIETYLWPIVAQTRPHDMLGVTSGYSQFHSSFLPIVTKAAQKYKADLRRLVAAVAFKNPVNVDEVFLESAAKKLQGSGLHRHSDLLSSFHVPQISPHRISNSLQSVHALIDGMIVSSAKRSGTRTVLQLVPSAEEVKDLVIPEFVIEDSRMVMGRVTFGSFEVLKQVLEIACPHVFMFLVCKEPAWAKSVMAHVIPVVGTERAIPVNDSEVRKLFIVDILNRIAQRFGSDAILIYGITPILKSALITGIDFQEIFIFNFINSGDTPLPNTIIIHDWSDWKNLNIKFNCILCGVTPLDADNAVLPRLLSPQGCLVTITPAVQTGSLQVQQTRIIHINTNVAYAGIVDRFLMLENNLSCNRQEIV